MQYRVTVEITKEYVDDIECDTEEEARENWDEGKIVDSSYLYDDVISVEEFKE